MAGWRDGQLIDQAAQPPSEGWRSGVPLDAAPRPLMTPPGGIHAPPRESYPLPTVDIIPPAEMQASADAAAAAAAPTTGAAAPYVAGQQGDWTAPIFGAYSLVPGIGPLAAYFWSQGMTPADAAREIGQGATLNAGDEALAMVKAGLSPDLTYDQALAQERQANAAIEQEFPVTSAIAQTAGAVGAGVLTSGLLGVAAPSSTIGRVAVGGVTGGAAGGIDAFNRGEGDFSHRMRGVPAGATVGAAIGAGIPIAAKLGGMAWNALRGPAATAYDDALRILRSKFKADDVTPAGVQQRLDDLGPDAMIVDSAGPNVSRLGGSMYRAPGPASTAAYDALTARARGQGERVYNAFTGTYAPGQTIPDYVEATKALIASRSAAARPLFERAFASGTAVSDARIDEFLASPLVRDGIKRGLLIQRNESLAAGVPFNPTEYAVIDFNAAGDPIIGQVPNFRLLDAGKRGLDEILESFRDPTSGRLVLNEYGRSVEAVRKAYVTELDRVNPDYAAARAAWAGPSQAMDAMDLGRRIVTEDNRRIADLLSGMSAADREFVQIGVVDAVRKTIAQAPDAADVVKRIFGNDWKRSALEALFDNPNHFAAFRRQMDAEAKFFLTQSSIMGNSASAERGAADAANGVPNFGSSVGGGIALDLATGQAPGTLGATRMFLDTLLSDMPRATVASNAEIARILFSRTPAENAAALDALARAGIVDAQTGRLLQGGQTGFAGLLGGESPPWLSDRRQGRGLLGVQ